MSRKLSALRRTDRVRADLQKAPADWYRVGAIRNEVVGEQQAEDGEAPSRSTADVYVYESIGGWFGMTADDFVRDVAGLDVDHINLHLNSPGGDVFEGVAMANVLRQHRATVTVWVDGLAASAASVIAMAGDEIVMGLGGQFMIHDALTYAYGNAEDLAKTIEVLNSVSDSLSATYAAKAGGTAAEWRAVMQAERWYTGEQAVEVGLADRVATDDDRGIASGEQIVPGSKNVTFGDWWDSASSPERHAATVAALYGRPLAAVPQTPAASAGGSTPSQEDDDMSHLTEGLRQRLGIAENADEATILAALDEALTERAEPESAPQLPPGTVAVDETVWNQTRADAAAGREAREQQQADKRERLVDAAVRDGRIAPSSREGWLTALAKDPHAEANLTALAPGLLPVAEIGHATADADTDVADFDGDLDTLTAQLGLPKGSLL